jgi:hypothetical protein
LDQNPDATWAQLVGSVEVLSDTGGASDQEVISDDSDEFASFKL